MERAEGDGPLVLLLHGFGAPGDDLVSLADVLNVPAGTRFVFPEGPLSLSFGPERCAGLVADRHGAYCAGSSGRPGPRPLAGHSQRPRSGARDDAGFPERDRTEIRRRSAQDHPRGILPGRHALLRSRCFRPTQPYAGLVQLSGNAPGRTGMGSAAPETQRAAGLSKPRNAG